MKKGRYIIFAAALAAAAAFNVHLAVSNKSYHRKSGGMNMLPMNDEKLIIKYTLDESGNRVRREVVLEAVTRYSLSRQNATSEVSEPDKTPRENKTEDIYSEVKINAYPNPNQGMFWISISGIDIPSGAAVEIFSSGGALIKKWKGISQPHAVDISDRPAGIYFLRITFGKDFENVWKIVKN